VEGVGGGGNFLPASRSQPRRTARILGGRNRAEISLSFFEFFSEGERKRKIVRENFCEVAAGAIAEADGGAESVRFSCASPRAPRVAHCQRF